MLVTPLHEWHRGAAARMVDFAGWDMPLSYALGPLEEHRLVRRSAGLFDVSHMGQVLVSGRDALAWLETMVSAPLVALEPDRSTYALLCRDDGGVLDDLFIYRLAAGGSPAETWLVVVNAANREKDVEWLRRHLPATGVDLNDASDDFAMFAFQGPKALGVADRLTDGAASEIPRFGSRRFAVIKGSAGEVAAGALPAPIDSNGVIVGRTGYTGEDGVELFVPAANAVAVWELILAEAKAAGVECGPVGLAARDSLRFEPGFALYGHELTEEITPVEARVSFACDFEKQFIGRDAIVRRKDEGDQRRLATITMTDRGVPREGYRVMKNGRPVGHVATGLYAPTIDAYCANVFVPAELAKTDTVVEIEIRNQIKSAVVVKRPLYRPAYR